MPIIPHHCLIKHDPPNSYGDCLRAAVASMLGVPCVDEVPHFCYDGDDEQGTARLKEWLLTRGLRPFYTAQHGDVSLAALFKMMKGINTDIPYLLFHTSVDANHVVVCVNDKVVHNPAWSKSGITGPADNGYWVMMVFVPA